MHFLLQELTKLDQVNSTIICGLEIFDLNSVFGKLSRNVHLQILVRSKLSYGMKSLPIFVKFLWKVSWTNLMRLKIHRRLTCWFLTAIPPFWSWDIKVEFKHKMKELSIKQPAFHIDKHIIHNTFNMKLAVMYYT